MRKILFIENDVSIAKLVSELLLKRVGNIETRSVPNISQAIELINKNDYFICVADTNLNDINIDAFLAKVAEKNLPTILLLDTIDDALRQKLSNIDNIDYLLKLSMDIYNHLAKNIHALIKNSEMTVLIAEDSMVYREMYKNILENQLFTVKTAINGQEALDIITQDVNNTIKLVVTDYIMPVMDGFELTAKLREMRQKDELAIIAVSSEGHDITTEKFLKFGANDFIKKPFSREELICRVNNTLEYLELIDTQKQMAHTDYLTGLYNRRYLMDTMNIFHANAVRGNLDYVVGMIDIDDFKTINDTYGHDAGDIIIRSLAHTLKETFRSSDIVSRIGGEEFCIVLTNVADQNIFQVFEKLRHSIAQKAVKIEEGIKIRYTVSIGICATIANTFEGMLKIADEMLYEAKHKGKNKVCPDF